MFLLVEVSRLAHFILHFPSILSEFIFYMCLNKQFKINCAFNLTYKIKKTDENTPKEPSKKCFMTDATFYLRAVLTDFGIRGYMNLWRIFKRTIWNSNNTKITHLLQLQNAETKLYNWHYSSLSLFCLEFEHEF